MILLEKAKFVMSLRKFFRSLSECPMFFDNFVKLIQTRKHLECEDFQRSSTLHGSWMRLIFRMSLMFTLSKSLYLATGHRKSIKIQQIQSKLFKLKPLDEIFGEMAKNSIALKLTIYLVIWIILLIHLSNFVDILSYLHLYFMFC